MAEEQAPDPQKIMRLARQAMSSSEYRRKFHMADFWGLQELYPPQLQFFADGAQHHQRLIRGGNQVGKSLLPARSRPALHLTGAYPRWWTGRRFTQADRGWSRRPDAQLVRDGPQRQLTAKQGEFGTGTIPLATFAGKPVMVPGGTGSIDTMQRGRMRPTANATALAPLTVQDLSSRARRRCNPNPSTGYGSTSAVARKSTAS